MTKLSTTAIVLLLFSVIGVQTVTPVAAGEQSWITSTPPVAKESVSVDCKKEVWPNLSPSCLRNAQAIEVRVVTVNRR